VEGSIKKKLKKKWNIILYNMCKQHVLYGLYCNKDQCSFTTPLSEINPNILLTIIGDDKKDVKSHFDCTFPYNQYTCTFCYSELCSKLLITLECKHTFHLYCFINYMKVKYIDTKNELDDKNENISSSSCLNCPLCRVRIPDFLSIFEKYKELLVFIERCKTNIT
jgi:hypothetical protein